MHSSPFARRVETYEIELKKLRIRVDELKRELTVVQDEADAQSNLSRRLQRSNDELEDQVASLKVSVEHMTARARANNGKCRSDGSPLRIIKRNDVLV